MKKVLITGALGLVGSHIAESLAISGYKVIGIDNLKTGRRINIPENQENIELMIEDIVTPNFLSNVAKKFNPEVIIHTAASYADPSDWIGDAVTNIEGSINVAKAALQTNSRVIYFQTALCYGLNPNQNPIKIDYPRNPAPSSYAISKTAGELYLESAKLDLVTFRLANIIGPRNLSGALPIFYKRISQSEKCTIADARRDFVDVRDIIPVVKKAVEGVGSGPYHLSSGKDVAIFDLYTEVLNAIKNKNQPDPDRVPNPAANAFSILLDPSKTISDFGVLKFRPLSETVSAAIDFYKKFGVSEERTHFHFKNK